MASPSWNRLRPKVMSMLRERLGAEFSPFANICEELGLLENNFLELDQECPGLGKLDEATTCSFFGSAAVSAANYLGTQGDLANAARLANWALMIEPNHVPALMCLETIAALKGDDSGAQHCADRRLAIEQSIMSADSDSLSAFEHGIRDALEQRE